MAQEEASFFRLADALPYLVWVRQRSGELEFVNAAWSRYAEVEENWSPAEIVSRVVHAGDLCALAERHEVAIATGEPYELEIRVRRRDGAERWHRARVEPVLDARGQVERWVGSATDVHGAREGGEGHGRAPSADGEDMARAQLDALFEGATFGLALLDRDLRVVRINRVLAAIQGLAPQDIVGRVLGEIADELSPVAAICERVLRTGEPFVDQNFRWRGSSSWFVSYYPVRVRGEVTGVAGLVVELTERVRAEQGYELVNRATNDAIRDCDLGSGEVHWNDAVSTLFGYSAGEVRPDIDWWRERIHPDDRARVVGGVERAIVGRAERWVDEYRFARRDGSFARVLDRGWVARDHRGRAVRMVASMFDVTEHRRTEAELAAILDAAPIAFAVYDRDLRFRRVNRAMADLDNLPIEVHLGHTLAELVPWVEPMIEPLMRRVYDTGESVTGLEMSVMVPHRQGLPGHFLVSYYPWVLDGAIEGIVEAVLDITARKRSEEAVALLAEAGRALAESFDLDATLARVVALLVPAFGDWCVIHLRRDDDSLIMPAVAHVDAALERRMRELLVRDNQRPQSGRSHVSVMATGRSVFAPDADSHARAIARDEGDLATLLSLDVASVMIVPLPVQKTILGTLTLGTWKGSGRRLDADHLALAEELGRRLALALDNVRLLELSRREQARVEAANRAKDEFLAVVSHELRTPLQAILGWSRVLRRPGLTEEQRQKAIDAIDRNATAQAGLVKDLLDITRIITGKMQLRIAPCELVQIAEASVDIVRPAAEAKGVELVFAADPPVIPIACDAERVQQIVWNLLTNAIKFTDRGGTVKLDVTVGEGEQAVIRVKDTGRGIQPEFLPYIFDKFRQEEVGTTRQHGGLGLGLAIVRHLVEGHGGTIEAHSEGAGRGAEFTVRLPAGAGRAARVSAVVSGPAGKPSTLDEAPRDVDLRGLQILIVDDERDARELVGAFLQPTGATVLMAENSEQALALVEMQRPDVIVSDVAMPGEDGYDWMRRLRQRPAEEGGRTPALALTAYARLEDRAQALLAGYQKHLSKPCEPHELITAIAELAGREPR